MSTSKELELIPDQDRTSGLTSEGRDNQVKKPRAVLINFVSVGNSDRFRIDITPHPDYAKDFPVTQAEIPLTREELWAIVSDCTEVWRNKVVYYRRPLSKFYPFQRRSEEPLSLLKDLKINIPFVYNAMLKELAEAGQKLFQQIFRPPVEGFEKVQEIGRALQNLMKFPDLWIKITSDKFYAPWNLMYLGDVRKEVSAEKFWGYQHFIEHDPSDKALPPRVFKPKLNIALHLDEGIDKQFNTIKCNEYILERLNGYETVSINQRNSKEAFLAQLDKGAVEELFYFCCHAVAEGDTSPSFGKARLMLTDTRPEDEKQYFPDARANIEPNDIDLYLDQRNLLNSPIVFMNCCQIAKMSSVFYRGFASKFLHYYASAVIGPNIETPAVFARDFAGRFFDRFFQGGPERNLGSVLLNLRREFFDKHKNPLGLVYLLYRGADTHIEGPVLKR